MRAFGVWPRFIKTERAYAGCLEHTRFDLAHDVHFTRLAIKAQGQLLFAVDEL